MLKVILFADLCTEQDHDSAGAGTIQQILWKKWFWLLMASLFQSI